MNYIENGKSNKEFYCSNEIPNIFLIGDSIRKGYCDTVKEELGGIAEVFYVNDNCRNTQYVITCLESWKNKFDNPDLVNIVHFNCGHWDIAQWSRCGEPLTSEDEYAKNIKLIIKLIKMKFKNAKIVFATTTPMNPDNVHSKNYRDNASIDRYNEIAVKIVKESGLIVNDLNELTKDLSGDCYLDYCHFTEDTAAFIGKAVADKLKSLL